MNTGAAENFRITSPDIMLREALRGTTDENRNPGKYSSLGCLSQWIAEDTAKLVGNDLTRKFFVDLIRK